MRRSTGIVLIVFVVLLGVTIYLQQNPLEGQETPTPRPQPKPLFSFSADQVQTINVEDAAGQEVTVQRAESGWEVTTPDLSAGQSADQLAINAAVMQVQNLQVVTEFETPPPLEDLGLDAPAYFITLFFEEQGSVLLVGEATPTESGYYAQFVDGEPIVVNKSPLDGLLDLLRTPPILEAEIGGEAAPSPAP